MITHRYGKEGRDSTKYEDKCLLFDFELFENFTKSDFVTHYKTKLQHFVTLLNEQTSTGGIFKFFCYQVCVVKLNYGFFFRLF